MSEHDDKWPAGTPSWVDLTTSDRDAAWTFYAAVFGWHIRDTGADSGHYGIAEIGGRRVAGLGGAMEGDPTPPHWLTYLATDDVEATAAAVAANGGGVLFGPVDVMGEGWMLVAQDPTGAAFGVWQAGRNTGAQLVNEPGSVVWNHLNTTDIEAAKAFYAAVFGYEYSSVDAGSAMIAGAGPGGVIGGMSVVGDDLPPGTPSHWGVYFSVADADAFAAAVLGNGGQVVAGPVKTPFGRMVVASDPQGAQFCAAEVGSD